VLQEWEVLCNHHSTDFNKKNCNIFTLNVVKFHYSQLVEKHRLNHKQTSWLESARELYRPNECRLSVKLVTTFVDRVCCVVSVTDSYGRILSSRPEPLLFLPSSSLNCTHEAEWTPFQTHYFSENLVAPGFEPGPQDM
jgi:hypothetical protein